ncbi:GAF domain-containing protein, partial [Halobium palmae]
MSGVSTRVGGGLVAVIGGALSLYHLFKLTEVPPGTVPILMELVPLLPSLSLVAVGVLIARGEYGAKRYVGRMLGWMVVGSVALSLLAGWTLAGAVLAGFPPRNAVVPLLNSATVGALVGLLVGLYDARGLEQQRSLEEVNRINDTLRIATQELVSNADRDVLEQAVCDRLRESDPYEAAWVGRYDPDAGQVLPVAWAGLDDGYFDGLVVTVDDSPTGEGAGGRAVKTGEIQCVPDVFADETMEPWWHLFETRGVESLAVVPIRGAETVYGFISVYADRPSVFEEREQEALSELGETIGHAIDTIETHERLAERERELARQNERLEEFAGVVSHDLRNPLNVADGYLELAREEGDDRYFDRVGDALDRMGELIDDLLAL